ncbi:Lrp/AsnC ligand binding domain-containing protein [Schaalia sp. 19OD2882]|uniref:Lrp/AsnC family transcriptional regulator n=1 Tax=Schaalia sp. 19OD2882 TaxID=2794089 RepID=UPI001C1E97BC|nr:Lrp/AsnC ligand binding domain-containing protein [Schaalia sp. 19OD2882]QWW18859.1 Lrp/AsnC ligand binding domain-containing protein [Schaalia sp. 19OD2882]
MLSAIVLINADVDSIPEVASAIADLEGVDVVYSVTGDIDLVALVRVRQHEDLAEVVSNRMGKVPGIRQMRTHIAFRSFASADLEEAFHIGLG